MKNDMIYPMYYRKEGRCLKAISSTVAYVITLPPQAIVPLRDVVTFPSNERLVEEVSKMNEATDQTWREFLFEFYRGVNTEHQIAAKLRSEQLMP